MEQRRESDKDIKGMRKRNKEVRDQDNDFLLYLPPPPPYHLLPSLFPPILVYLQPSFSIKAVWQDLLGF
jgi:hypothetical protein